MPKIFTDADREIHKIKLLDKGMDLIAQRGLKDVSVSELAAVIDVSKGYFYTLFASKEQFFFEGLLWRMRQNLNKLETAKKRGAGEEELYDLVSHDIIAYAMLPALDIGLAEERSGELARTIALNLPEKAVGQRLRGSNKTGEGEVQTEEPSQNRTGRLFARRV